MNINWPNYLMTYYNVRTSTKDRNLLDLKRFIIRNRLVGGFSFEGLASNFHLNPILKNCNNQYLIQKQNASLAKNIRFLKKGIEAYIQRCYLLQFLIPQILLLFQTSLSHI